MFDNILVALDGSKNSFDALDVGIGIAQKFGSKLHIVSVINVANLPTNVGVSYAPELTESLQKDAQKNLDIAEKRVKTAGLTCYSQIINGDPRSELSHYSQQVPIDLIIIGRTGLHGIVKFLLGSVTRYVSEHSKKDILIVS